MAVEAIPSPTLPERPEWQRREGLESQSAAVVVLPYKRKENA